VAIDVLGVTDAEGEPILITIDSIFQDEPVDSTLIIVFVYETSFSQLLQSPLTPGLDGTAATRLPTTFFSRLVASFPGARPHNAILLFAKSSLQSLYLSLK